MAPKKAEQITSASSVFIITTSACDIVGEHEVTQTRTNYLFQWSLLRPKKQDEVAKSMPLIGVKREEQV